VAVGSREGRERARESPLGESDPQVTPLDSAPPVRSDISATRPPLGLGQPQGPAPSVPTHRAPQGLQILLLFNPRVKKSLVKAMGPTGVLKVQARRSDQIVKGGISVRRKQTPTSHQFLAIKLLLLALNCALQSCSHANCNLSKCVPGLCGEERTQDRHSFNLGRSPEAG